MKTVTLYTDGACSGNPGPGGWGAILIYNGHEKEMSGGEGHRAGPDGLSFLHGNRCVPSQRGIAV